MAKKSSRPIAAERLESDCCDDIDVANWPTRPYRDRLSSGRWGAILFCGDISDSLHAFGNTLGVIYKTLTEALHVPCDNVRVLYNGTSPTTYASLPVVGAGTKENLYELIREADASFDVLFLVLLGHGAAKPDVEEAGLVCVAECDSHEELPTALIRTCGHPISRSTKRHVSKRGKRLVNDILTPRELTAQLSVLANCTAHVSAHCCGSGIFAEVSRVSMVSSFTSATNRDGATVLCPHRPYWQAPFLWAHSLAVQAELRPLRSAMLAAYLDMVPCLGAACPVFV